MSFPQLLSCFQRFRWTQTLRRVLPGSEKQLLWLQGEEARGLQNYCQDSILQPFCSYTTTNPYRPSAECARSYSGCGISLPPLGVANTFILYIFPSFPISGAQGHKRQKAPFQSVHLGGCGQLIHCCFQAAQTELQPRLCSPRPYLLTGLLSLAH